MLLRGLRAAWGAGGYAVVHCSFTDDMARLTALANEVVDTLELMFDTYRIGLGVHRTRCPIGSLPVPV